jgi:hypothetical protein
MFLKSFLTLTKQISILISDVLHSNHIGLHEISKLRSAIFDKFVLSLLLLSFLSTRMILEYMCIKCTV